MTKKVALASGRAMAYNGVSAGIHGIEKREGWREGGKKAERERTFVKQQKP